MSDTTATSPTTFLTGHFATPVTTAGQASATVTANEAPLIEFPGLTEDQWREAKAKLNDLRIEGEKFVRENPGRAVLYAVGAGFVLGLLLRR